MGEWSKRFLPTQDERDILEAVDRLHHLSPRKFTTRDVYEVSGVPWRTFWRPWRLLRRLGLTARMCERKPRGGGRGGWWEITERGKIALAIQRGCEARARAVANRREAVLNAGHVDRQRLTPEKGPAVSAAAAGHRRP